MLVWPQYLVLALYIMLTLASVIRHGQPISNPVVNAGQVIWTTTTLFFILGVGGFWKPLGW